ncbi:PDZ domain-containing protein [Hydrogenimonas sp.]
MKRLFEKTLPVLLWFSAVVLAAKLTALFVDASLPPLASQDCSENSERPHERYHFVRAFGLKNALHQKKRKTSRPKRRISLTGYDLTMTAIGNPSMAIIVHHGKSRLIAVGESIDGFKLTKVFTDSVKLVRDGREYTLSMKKKKTSSSISMSTVVEKEKSGSKENEYAEQIRREGDTYYIPRELLEEMHDVKKIFKYISIKPIHRNGHLYGFGISRVKKGSVFDKMGLRKRDIIKMVDGKPFTNEAEVFGYFNKINDLSSLTLTIKRGSELKELHYEIF